MAYLATIVFLISPLFVNSTLYFDVFTQQIYGKIAFFTFSKNISDIKSKSKESKPKRNVKKNKIKIVINNKMKVSKGMILRALPKELDITFGAKNADSSYLIYPIITVMRGLFYNLSSINPYAETYTINFENIKKDEFSFHVTFNFNLAIIFSVLLSILRIKKVK